MTSPTARAADNKREEYRKYLERSGILDLLTRAMTTLYEEPDKPEDPVRYICNLLGHSFETQPTIDAMQTELEELRDKVQRLREENAYLRSSLGDVDRAAEAMSKRDYATTSGSTSTTVSASNSQDSKSDIKYYGMQDSKADFAYQ